VEGYSGFVTTGQSNDTVQRGFTGIAQVVNDGDVVAVFKQFQDGVGSDVPRTTGHEDVFGSGHRGHVFMAGKSGFAFIVHLEKNQFIWKKANSFGKS